ncbi:glycosyltransferase family A protein [Flavobacterium sp. CAU 1735]|uniref:glycosyltransferase family 2 protein n=1 Tax=Flavobacterium sp. CAU 1735 TaxID=3140361 RepID=UPI0032616D29
MAFFSVIIPLYNKEAHIQSTLNSILNQTFTDFEVVIINDGSTDRSLEIVESYTDKRIQLFTTENRGVSAARNLAMQKASGSYFAFIDADDFWYPQHLEKLYDTIIAFDHLSVFSTLQEIETANGVFLASHSNLTTDLLQEVDLFETSLTRSILAISSLAIHRNVIETVGFFNETISNGEDTDYFIRIGFRYKIGLYNGITSRYAFVSGSLSNRAFQRERYCDFEQFSEIEKSNPTAKKVIDLNRFSLAIKCKIYGDRTNYNQLVQSIDQSNLVFKQRLLLQLPAPTLILLHRFKNYLEKKNIRLSAF